jgi:large subunit ribosomal protein L15
MIELFSLKNTHRKKVSPIRVGRGIGSGKGKTCGRGTKGMKARSGYKRRWGTEGGQLPVFRKIPVRGFSRTRFQDNEFSINLGLLDTYFNEGDVVNLQTLRDRGVLSNKENPIIKVLGNGQLTKKLILEVNAVSKTVEAKVAEVKGEIRIIS